MHINRQRSGQIVHLCRQASEWGSIGSQFFHTDNPQCNKHWVASKTAPSPPKHDRPRANRTRFRHVSYCWLVPACIRSRISKDTPSNVAQSQHWGAQRPTWFIRKRPKTTTRTVEGRSKVTARMSLACLLSHIFHSNAPGCASMRILLTLEGPVSTFSRTALFWLCPIKKHRITSAIVLLIDLSWRNDQAECSTLIVHHVPVTWASKTGNLNAARGVVAELTHRSWHTLS